MKKQMSIGPSFVGMLAIALGVLFLTPAAQARKISKKAMCGPYAITLKVLPAESFNGPKAEMARDGGARVHRLNGPTEPNHHLVVFVREHGKPVEDAKVTIRYRELSPRKAHWKKLPVVRMHVAGKGLSTTHYGNNVNLPGGKYVARVSVNWSKPAIFHFALGGSAQSWK